MLKAHKVIAAAESAADPATTGAGVGAGAGGVTSPLRTKSTLSVIASF